MLGYHVVLCVRREGATTRSVWVWETQGKEGVCVCRALSVGRGVLAHQFDAPESGFITSDNFGNAELICEQTLGKVGGRCVLVTESL